MAVEARFYVAEKTERGSNPYPDASIDGKMHRGTAGTEVVLHASLNEDNKSWSEYTPSGKITMSITNPPAESYFEAGESYRVVFTKVMPSKSRTTEDGS